MRAELVELLATTRSEMLLLSNAVRKSVDSSSNIEEQSGTEKFAADLNILTSELAAYRGRAQSTVVKWATGSGDTLSRLKSGDHTITIERIDRIMAWFDQNWAEDLDWPSSVARPSRRAA